MLTNWDGHGLSIEVLPGLDTWDGAIWCEEGCACTTRQGALAVMRSLASSAAASGWGGASVPASSGAAEVLSSP